ncbi:hypothetical protein D3C86_1160480 [compost metagenome]
MHAQHGGLGLRLTQHVQPRFRNAEEGGYGRGLHQRGQTIGVIRAHVVAGIHPAQTDTAVLRRNDAREPKQALGVGDPRAVQLALRGVGAHLGFGGVQLLPRHRFLARQLAVALQVGLRVVQQRLGASQLAFGRGQRGLIRAGVNLGQQLAAHHGLALGVMHAHQFAVDLAAQHDLGQRRDGAQGMQVALQRADAGRRHADGNRNLPVLGRRWSAGATVSRQPITDADQHGQQQGGGGQDQSFA